MEGLTQHVQSSHSDSADLLLVHSLLLRIAVTIQHLLPTKQVDTGAAKELNFHGVMTQLQFNPAVYRDPSWQRVANKPPQ